MCMCVKTVHNPLSGVVYVLGGFEDGSVVMWDCRNNSEEMASLKLFPEPGKLHFRAFRLHSAATQTEASYQVATEEAGNEARYSG